MRTYIVYGSTKNDPYKVIATQCKGHTKHQVIRMEREMHKEYDYWNAFEDNGEIDCTIFASGEESSFRIKRGCLEDFALNCLFPIVNKDTTVRIASKAYNGTREASYLVWDEELSRAALAKIADSKVGKLIQKWFINYLWEIEEE